MLSLRVNRDNEEAILQEKQFVDTIYNTSLDAYLLWMRIKELLSGVITGPLNLFEIESKKEIEGTNIENWFIEDHIKLFNDIEQNLATKQVKTGRVNCFYIQTQNFFCIREHRSVFWIAAIVF